MVVLYSLWFFIFNYLWHEFICIQFKYLIIWKQIGPKTHLFESTTLILDTENSHPLAALI